MSPLFAFLISFASLFGVEIYPHGGDVFWPQNISWTNSEAGRRFQIESTTLPEACSKSPPGSYVNFPVVLMTNQSFYADGKLIRSTAGSFEHIEATAPQLIVRCDEIKNAKSVRWSLEAEVKAFASIKYLPYISSFKPRTGTITNFVNLLGCGAALTLGIISLIFFNNTEFRSLRIPLAISAFAGGIYAASLVPGPLGLDLDGLTLSKLAVSSVWISNLMVFYLYRIQGYISKKWFVFIATWLLVGILTALFAPNPDVAGIGTLIDYPPTFVALIFVYIRILKDKSLSKKSNYSRLVYLACPATFIFFGFLEMFSIMGVFIGPYIFPIGIVMGLLFYVLSLNEQVNETFRERDYLRENLEIEVQEKTQALKVTLAELLETQAQMVQNAKLASLGILAGGMAHDINNAINFIAGALGGIKRIIGLKCDEKGQEEAGTYLSIMDSGVKIASQVVNSLRNHSRTSSIHERTELRKALDDVLTLTHSRLELTKIEIDVPQGLHAYISEKALYEIFMNLILNAVDAMQESPQKNLFIVVKSLENAVELKVTDTGSGILEENLPQIYDPFFTTKPIGQGSGLGLYIVKKHIDELKGQISIESREGLTCFTLTIPNENRGN